MKFLFRNGLFIPVLGYPGYVMPRTEHSEARKAMERFFGACCRRRRVSDEVTLENVKVGVPLPAAVETAATVDVLKLN